MTNSWTSWLVLATGVLTLLSGGDAQAQVLGTFRWQFAPYCNVVSLRVEQKGATYELAGTDNRCGASVAAAARGTAHLNLDGTVGMGLTIHRPDGIPVQVTVSLDGSLSGTWRDNFNNAGSFLLNPAVTPAGAVRPITIVGNYVVHFLATSASSTGSTAINFGLTLPQNPSAVLANFIVEGAPPTANCPGSAATPLATPGRLCVYESDGLNVGLRCLARTGEGYACNSSDATGTSVFVRAAAAGSTVSAGRWAVTIE